MKSETLQNMMLRYLIVFGLVSLALAQSTANTNKPVKKQAENKYMKSASAIDLKKQQFQSTKERPGLNPVLSALINEDVKKSIDSKRHAEYDLSPLSEVSSVRAAAALAQSTTVAPVQTTVKYIPKTHDDSVVVDSIAGSSSEKKQTSRIEIKKGPNGIDYEYEYVYYYYDDDEKDSKKSAAVSDDKSIESQNGGKNRYDKSSTTPKPNFEHNELPTSRGKGRQSIPVIEETSEERLPVNTRFPPRSAVTPTVQVISNVDETTKKISVKRPSLELVDSQSFNRGEKGQSKGSRVLENEFAKVNDVKLNENPTVIPSVTELVSQNAAAVAVGAASSEFTTVASDSEESTTQIMDKVALDLYAHLVNENSNIDLSTETASYEESSTSDSLPTTTEELTTVETLTTTTTTTTQAATTTTTTTETPTLINGRRTPFGAGRRNSLKNRSKPTETKANPEESKEETTVQEKPKSRFSRPSFSARSRPTPTVAATVGSEEEEVVKQKAKPVAAVTASRGRTRNRFNLRSSTPQSITSEEKNPDENAIDSSAHTTTTTHRALRTRPTFNLRGRSRATPTSTSAPSDATEQALSEAKVDSEEKPATSNPSKPLSRFNLRRPNQLLSPRGRLSPFAKTAAPSAEQSVEVNNSTDASSSTTIADWSRESADESEQVAVEPSTTPQTGLNRLRNRPRIQIQPKAPSTNKQPTAASYNNANRKVNPLISRRKIGTSTTTEESPVTENSEASGEIKEPQSELSKEINSSENDGNDKEEAPAAPVETSSEPARGLGLLANRRRLAVRRPGTIL